MLQRHPSPLIPKYTTLYLYRDKYLWLSVEWYGNSFCSPRTKIECQSEQKYLQRRFNNNFCEFERRCNLFLGPEEQPLLRLLFIECHKIISLLLLILSGCRSWDTVVCFRIHHRLPMPALIRIFVSCKCHSQCFRWIILQLESWRIYLPTTNRGNSLLLVIPGAVVDTNNSFRKIVCVGDCKALPVADADPIKHCVYMIL